MYINKTEGKKYKFFKLSAKQQNLIKNFWKPSVRFSQSCFEQLSPGSQHTYLINKIITLTVGHPWS